MTPTSPSFWRRHRAFRWTLIAGASALVVLSVVLAVVVRHAEPFLRARIVAGLSGHFRARVEIDSFHISLGNSLHGEWGLWAQGRGLRIWPPENGQVTSMSAVPPSNEPLINLQSFRFHVPLRINVAWPLRIGSVRLAGLRIHIPPKQPKLQNVPQEGSSLSAAASVFGHIQIGRIQCSGADLIIESSRQGKLPLEFAVAQLTLDSITQDGSMHYQADLTNPRPPGVIQASGTFGPWVVEDPGESPVTGAYSFSHADLSVFHGITGMLDSTGSYRGVLRELTVDGETNTPDFRLMHTGNPLPLHTRFHAIVDGTNGDTDLEPVEAILGRSSFTARGKIVHVRAEESSTHVRGHDIALTVNATGTQIGDFLRFATSGSTPLLTGNLAFNASLHIPPGNDDVQQRLELHGHFDLDQAEFTSDKVQGRVRELSLRARGRPGEAKSFRDDPPPPDNAVQSSMHSDFSMENGVIKLPNLDYTVPGVDIRLHGTYAIDGGTIDFTGKARIKATVSQMVGGWKGLLLKPVDSLFKKDGAGAEFPVHVGGTREDPEFGVDFNRIKSTSPQTPGAQPETYHQSPAQP